MKLEEIYTSGEYLEKHPTWHTEEAPRKVRHIVPMMKRHRLVPDAICELGCGTGEVLRLLQENMSDTCTCCGYDISPQAFTRCLSQHLLARMTYRSLLI